MNNKKWSIIYAGLDTNTFFVLLNDQDFSIKATAFIDKFCFFTINPVNYLFKAVYFLRKNGTSYILESLLAHAWSVLMPLSTGIFKKYGDFLYALHVHRIDIVDFDNLPKYLDYIESKKPDVLVTSVWPLLPKEIILAPKYKAVNTHPSMLPQYRGSLPTLWSLKNHDSISAVTYMIIDETMDTGNIIAQHKFSLDSNDDWYSTEVKIAKIIRESFASDLKSYLSGSVVPVMQSDVLPSKTATYEKYRKINWEEETVADVYNKINLYPYLDPGIFCYSIIKGRKIHFFKVDKQTNSASSNEQAPTKGEFKIFFPRVFFGAKDGAIGFKLFFDLGFRSSFFFLTHALGSLFKTMR